MIILLVIFAPVIICLDFSSWRRINDCFADDVNFMMNNNKEYATGVALNETGSVNCNGEKKLSDHDNTVNRSFGVTDLWRIRRNARTFKIHNRIPRL